MVRQLTAPRPRGWKATLAAFLAAGLVASHIMACVESPMSFSPTGDLAFVVMEPYVGEDLELTSDRAYRLMVLDKNRDLRELERSYTHMLTAPGFSPDGMQIAYLRVPLLTRDQRTRIQDFHNARSELLRKFDEMPESEIVIGDAPETADGASESVVFKGGSVSLTRLVIGYLDSFELMGGAPTLLAELVIRHTATGEVGKTFSIELPLPDIGAYPWSYFLDRSVYTPDGRFVVLSAHRMVAAVDVSTGEARFLTTGAMGFALSPGGDRLAAIIGQIKSSEPNLVELVDLDGARVTTVLTGKTPSYSGLAWTGRDLLGVLEKNGGSLDIYNNDGRLVRTIDLPNAKGSGSEEAGELGISPDAAYFAVSFGDEVKFLSANGTLLGTWQDAGDDERLLAQPAFTPDSRQVAFKLVESGEDEATGDEWSRTTAIVFFTPGGHELFRVPIPLISPEERPAQPAPSDEPSAESAPATEETQQ